MYCTKYVQYVLVHVCYVNVHKCMCEEATKIGSSLALFHSYFYSDFKTKLLKGDCTLKTVH